MVARIVSFNDYVNQEQPDYSDRIVSFKDYKKNRQPESITLEDWISMHPMEDELRTVFLNMDRAMRYIHEHDYCIRVFHPKEIEILNNEVDHIQFKQLMQLSSNPNIARKMIQEDIFNSAFIQIAIYFNKAAKLDYLNPDFMRENFDQFTQFIPEGDVPYYRGVIQRGASVYFCEFALEKRKHDLEEIEKQLGEEGNKEPVPIPPETLEEMTNSRVNDVIYKQINSLKEAAFVNLLLIPTIAISVLLLIGLILWIFSLF